MRAFLTTVLIFPVCDHVDFSITLLIAGVCEEYTAERALLLERS